MNILHLSAECYPAAKVGGLADVVGALPKYLNKRKVNASVLMPKYGNEWMKNHSFETVYEGNAPLGENKFKFKIQKGENIALGYPLYVIDIPGRFDRPGIYSETETGCSFDDTFERFLSFQIAALDWVKSMSDQPDIIHCHDHHMALLPFMISRSNRYQLIAQIPTVLTVHHAQYHGRFELQKTALLPDFDSKHRGLLEWDRQLNCLAAGLKCCWQISTVSPSYMQQLSEQSNGLEWLFENEQQKSRGILNGIDTAVWDPDSDSLIAQQFNDDTIAEGKLANKKALSRRAGFDLQYPLISYIGRLAHEKGADLLPDLFALFLSAKQPVNILLLGTGDRELHNQFEKLNRQYPDYFHAELDYNETLAHQIYAGSDFLVMPSRVEPCGLNQMYAMQYGTVPIVRNTGGLKDTVIDLNQPDGYGITFDEFTLEAAEQALWRALDLYQKDEQIANLRPRIMGLDFSWNASANDYIKMYSALIE
ncbi:starch synthase [Fodinibius salinus]|uniref:Glycogen synthase n=1 Tax=Fodinibius salinus TaxID=860790 RepID=A0A5D3YL53_9BACT|nr:glycogen/starch synthase [Fodinibius salinus]TYP94916.1 starch synthase [Fodinibius salinus]